MKKLIGCICVALVLAGCGTLDVYEKSVFFPTHEWPSSNKPSFTFAITDTVASYHIFVIFRHEDAYHYNNVWLNITTQAPRDTVRTQQINITLADNAKGWLGTGMDDVFDHRARITRLPIKLRKGNYTFTLQQTMREEPLRFVLNAGIRVEKVQP
ncbi:MAG: gldH [Sediminibacterium sp.]|nr:gldH [Sediminibacterium sp.]